jgi:glycosyltransferase involved in cell wall biosynthesis
MDAKTDDMLLPVRGRRPTVDLSIVAIIPLYNGGRWIEQSIASVLAQTLPPDEFIVVDDGSTDEGPEIVERMAKEHPITLLRKQNGGQSSARNFAVRHSSSKLIALLDQDDAWYPHHLAQLIKPFRKRRDIPLGWAYSNLDELDEQGRMVTKCMLDSMSPENPKRSLVTCLSCDMFILPSASLIARDAFDAIGGFDERLSGYEDDDFFLRLFRAGYDNVYLNKPLSKWRIYPSSTSYTFRMARSRMIYAEKLISEYPNNRRQAQFFVRDCIAPRFIANTLSNWVTALETKDRDMFNTANEHLEALIPHLPLKRRIQMTAALLFFRTFPIAIVMYMMMRLSAARENQRDWIKR